MNILFIAPYTPTPIRTRSYNLVHALAQRGHSLTLATLWENESERQALAEFEKHSVRVISAPLTKPRIGLNLVRALGTGKPMQSLYCWEPALARKIEAEIKQKSFDLIHIEHLRGSQYGLGLRSRMHLPVVWDSVDCISFLFEQAAHTSRNLFGRLVTRIELPRTRRYEAWLLGQFDRVLVTSEKDRVAFSDLSNTFASDRIAPDHIVVLPNGVAFDYFNPSSHERAEATIVFTGKMSYHANVTAVLYLIHEIMPYVWAQMPQVRVQIVGHKPGREIRNIAEKYPERVIVTGTVDDLRPYLGQATIAVAPMIYGAGIQNKVLEAMAMATPVVASSVAVSALSIRAEEHFLLGNTPDQFAQQILRLLNDRTLQERIARNGRLYVEQNYNWDRIAERLEEIYATAISTCNPELRSVGGHYVSYTLAPSANVKTAA